MFFLWAFRWTQTNVSIEVKSASCHFVRHILRYCQCRFDYERLNEDWIGFVCIKNDRKSFICNENVWFIGRTTWKIHSVRTYSLWSLSWAVIYRIMWRRLNNGNSNNRTNRPPANGKRESPFVIGASRRRKQMRIRFTSPDEFREFSFSMPHKLSLLWSHKRHSLWWHAYPFLRTLTP